LDHRFEHYIRRKLGDKVIDGMKPRSKIEMMNSWVQKVKFMFGNTTGLEGFEVHVLGVKDNPEKNVEDCFHTMEMWVLGVNLFTNVVKQSPHLHLIGAMSQRYLILW
jgi:hypothetical protein